MSENTGKMVFATCAGSPREMGRQYGEQAKDSIQKNLDLIGAKGDLASKGAFLAMAKRLLGEKLPDVLDELEGMAEGADVSLDRLILFNHVDLYGEEWLGECTPIAVSESADGPVLGKNDDAGVAQRHDYVARVSFPEQGLPLIQVTYAGWLNGLDSLNEAGLANGHCSVGSVFDKRGPRVDVRLWAYQLMRTCRTTEAFVAGMMDANLTGKGFGIILVDQRGTTSVLEAAVPLIAERDRGAAMVYATNLYMTEALKNCDARTPEAKFLNTCRYGYLRWIERTGRAPGSADDMERLLSAHDPYAPCRHGGHDDSETRATMIALPRDGITRVSNGNPCEGEFREVTFEQ